ncbi:VOC family protein [Streptococcus catagoni]|uniref:VOC family protein n=1 Tax=Streptococcus catagoni TaxID=2654874 RepID=UPI00140AF31D|nr:VOC family protein [Streptococcus catagoni]
MITAINVYLITNGNGKEAIEFYKDVFNAEVTSLTYWKDGVPDCPKEREDLVMNAQFDINGIRLQLSDENPDFNYRAGGNMSAAIIVDSVEAAKELYGKLKVDAQKILMELDQTFWSPAYANLIDKYGVMWQINTELAQ